MNDRTATGGTDFGGSVTAAHIAQAEAEVGTALERELADYFALIPRLTDFMGRLIASVDLAPGDPGALHAMAILLTRITTELQAVAHLVRLGYPVQAVTLTGTMLELMHTAGYIGANETYAAEWFAHADPTKSYPGSVKKTIAAVAEKVGAPPEAIEREHAVIYREICMAKHGNPMALGQTTMVSDETTVYLITGPHLSEQMLRLAYLALQHGARYALLAAIAFLHEHLRGEKALPFLEDLQRVTEIHEQLKKRTAARFPAPPLASIREPTPR